MPTIENNDRATTASPIHTSLVASSSCNQDIKRIFLVKSPLTLDWIELKIMFGDPENAYLVCDDNCNIKYYAGKQCYDIDEGGFKLEFFFDDIGSGWSREATLDELTSMTKVSDELNKLIGDLVLMLNEDCELIGTSLLSA